MAEAAELDVRSFVSLLAGVDMNSLAADELSEVVLDAELLVNAANAFSAAALEAFQRSSKWANDGALSAAGWVAARTGTPTRTLRARARAGGGLRVLPSAEPAARTGRLSPAHLTALGGCARRHPALAARDEALLVEQAEALDADSFAVAVRQWAECAASVDGPDPADVSLPEPVDELHLSETMDGRYRLDGSFSAEAGHLIHAALEAEVDRHLRVARHGDPSVPLVTSQVRAAALVDLVAQDMRREPSEASTPDRYRVAIVVQADERGKLPVACCDSAAFRVVLGADREVLDIGRLTSIWPAGIRRAITLRDGGCVFTGCDRPPSWCDVHHCQPWHDGGSTSIDNGVLLCRRHHTFVHRHRWSISLEHHRAVTRKPDGSLHQITRWDTAAQCPVPQRC